uniref:Arf-GAP domain-containing protein n=1 Tax=Stomoxys calcitrans TaxID=35570 RepID=A0A1I8Q1A3_STOCA
MAMVRKKQDDKHLEALRELITTGGGNRQCFDCGQKGPTYVNMTIGSFVCTRCSGVLRGLTPPHRVKSISMATFTQDEIDFLKAHGNDVCAKTWLGLWDPKRAVHQDQRELMIDKYERKRYYLEPASPLKSLTNATNLKTSSSSTTATAIAASASASSATTSSALSSASNNNNNRSSNNNQNHHTHIQLTPPTSQRTTANGLHKSSSTAISRPHHHSTGQQQQQHNGFATDAFGLHNGLNISVGSASTGALSDTSSCASANGFGAEADFVADFGSADIFNATVASSSPASSVGSASTSNNGYAKIQPLKAAHQQFMNGHHHSGNASNNGNTIMANGGTAITNGNNSNSFANNGNTENFADFDHAPIYNAAEQITNEQSEEPNYQFIRKNAIRKKSLRSGSLTTKPNERLLRDINENEYGSGYGAESHFGGDDYMEFTPNEAYRQATNDFNSILDDFERFLRLSGQKRVDELPDEMFAVKPTRTATQPQPQSQPHHTSSVTAKFTPLALAAHATAMAVLGNQNHFNTPPHTSFEGSSITGSASMPAKDKSSNAQWDVWSLDSASKTIGGEQNSSASLATTTTTTSNAVPWQKSTPATSFTPTSFGVAPAQPYHFANGIQQQQQPSTAYFPSTAASIFATAAASIPTTATLSSMSQTANTNPFRMHLDVNDNNNHKATTNLFDATSSATAATSYSYNNHNNNLNSQHLQEQQPQFLFNSNLNDFNFVTNSNSNANFSSFCNNFYYSDNSFKNTDSNNVVNNYNNNNNNTDYNNFYNKESSNCVSNNIAQQLDKGNPFRKAISSSSATYTSIKAASPPPASSTSSFSTSTFSTTISNTSTIPPAYDPFSTDHIYLPPASNVVVVDENAKFKNNFQPHAVNGGEVASPSLEGSYNTVAANSFYTPAIDNFPISNQMGNSFCTTAVTNCNYNSNNNSYSYNDNKSNSWRLPMSNAPAADRYAALKDLDEQLRESKAVAAQAASIVTANVIESGFGTPNNGTVNPFATHAGVANPFQSANAPQNTTQLFGQMTLIPNGIAAANGFLNAAQKAQPNAGFFNYTANGFTNNANNANSSAMYATAAGPNGCGFGFGTMQQQIAASGPGLTANTFNNPFAASGNHNSNNPFL